MRRLNGSDGHHGRISFGVRGRETWAEEQGLHRSPQVECEQAAAPHPDESSASNHDHPGSPSLAC
jgi:hypothetical protein